MRRSWGAAIAGAVLWAAAGTALAAGPGTSAAPFLKLGFGARALGVGEAFVATGGDVAALHYNPAGLALAPSQGFDILVSHALHFQGIGLTQMGLVRRPWGVSINYLSAGGLERRTSETAQPDGTFGVTDLAIGVSAGKTFGAVSLGGTAKLIQQRIDEFSATAVGFDIGGLYRLQAWPPTFGVHPPTVRPHTNH